jgi:DNA-binding transcriptional LysR family regulator
MELRHLRYFVAVGEEQHFGRAADRLHLAQPALTRQIQDLEKEIGFELFERLPRGVKLNPAGKQFLMDARRILQDVSEATLRASRVARGQSGTLRIGFLEHISWSGVVPNSFARFREARPSVELQLQPSTTLEQLDAIRSGSLDAGFIHHMPKDDQDLDQLLVGTARIVLAVPKRHPLTKLKKLHLRDLVDVPFVWFPRRASPVLYDRLIHECVRGGLASPRVVQEGLNEATILSLVSAGMGVGWVLDTARGRSPNVIMQVADMDVPLPLNLAWRKDNISPLLAGFIQEVRCLPEVKASVKKKS